MQLFEKFPVSLSYSYAPLLLNVEDCETVVTASILNPVKDQNKNEPTLHTPQDDTFSVCEV